MNNAENNPVKLKNHAITLNGRATLLVSGVEEVVSFDEETVILKTSAGEMTVEGNGLHIVRLNLDTGDVDVTGRVSAILYADERQKTGGFFSRIGKN